MPGTRSRSTIADVVTRSLETLYPADPPRFLARTPHGYCDTARIASNLEQGGFTRPVALTTLPRRSRAPSPRHPAVAFCQGTPLRHEIEARNPAGVVEATEIATTALAARFGTGPIDGLIQAHVVVAKK